MVPTVASISYYFICVRHKISPTSVYSFDLLLIVLDQNSLTLLVSGFFLGSKTESGLQGLIWILIKNSSSFGAVWQQSCILLRQIYNICFMKYIVGINHIHETII